MRNINLLPRRKVSEAYFTYWVLLIVLITVLLAGGQFTIGIQSALEKERMKAEITYIETRIEAQNRKLVPDEKTTRFASLSQEVKALKEKKKDWLGDLVYIVGYLPPEASIVHIGAGESLSLRTELHFETNDDYLVFIRKLQAEPRFAAVKVNEVVRVIPAKVKDVPVLSEDRNIVNPPVNARDDERLEYFLPEGAQYQNYGDQLKAILEQKADSRPDASPDYSSFLGADSPFSLDELLSKFGSDAGAAPAEEPGASEAAVEEREYFRVVMEIQLRPSGKAGEQ